MRKRNIRLIVEYDGTNYFGWQLQKDQKTVQGELQRAIGEITGNKHVLVIGAGRTDAGVHAEGQVANFHTTSRLSCPKWIQAVNAHLPEDISIRSAEEVPLEFHAQFNALEKTYRYVILNSPARSALRRHTVQQVKPPLDAGAMHRCAQRLTGTHDFRAFGSEMSKKENTVRTIRVFTVSREENFIICTVTGDGFLYNQVRAMVGTLVEVGLGKHPPEWMGEILESKDRSKAGANLPAKGLTLVSVRYDA